MKKLASINGFELWYDGEYKSVRCLACGKEIASGPGSGPSGVLATVWWPIARGRRGESPVPHNCQPPRKAS